MSVYLDLVAGGLVSLPAGPRLSSAVPPHHVLIQLLRDVQVRHPDQVTSVLQEERWEDDEGNEGKSV